MLHSNENYSYTKIDSSHSVKLKKPDIKKIPMNQFI